MIFKTVEFVFNIPINTPANSEIYLTGDFPGSCYWRTDCLKLNHLGNNSFGITLRVPSIMKDIEFKVTRGTWETEAAGPMSDPLPNFFLPLSSPHTFFRYNIVNWADLPPLGVTGNLIYHENFYSPELNNRRTISVWLPPGYNKKKHQKKHYPVIYAHDGQNMFDPARSYLGVDWGIDETLTKMIDRGEVPEAIVVGIDCSSNRDAEYYFKDLGDQYAKFLIETLKPFIDQNYRTLPDRDNTLNMGSSMGALISFYIVWRYPEFFSKAAALAFPPSINNSEFLSVLDMVAKPNFPIKIYLDHGMLDIDADFKIATENFVTKLEALGYQREADFIYKVFPFSGHNESDWAARVDLPLKFLLKP